MTAENIHSVNHGTRYAYECGCRCDDCKAANAAYVTAWRHRTGRTDPAKCEQAAHSRSRYKAGCRCDICRAANAAMVRRRKTRRTL